MKRLTFDPIRESHRIRVATELRIVCEGEYTRNTSSRNAGQGPGILCGPLGDLIRLEIQACFNGGPGATPVLDADGNHAMTPNGMGKYSGYPVRWAMLLAQASLDVNPKQEAIRKLSLLYKQPTDFTGDISSPAWTWLKARSGLDRVLAQRQALTIGMGSCAMRPTMELLDGDEYRPAGVTVVPSDKAIAIPDPSRPWSPAVFIEYDEAPLDRSRIIYNGYAKEACTVWDMSNPAKPMWGRWSSPQAWLDGARPIWSMSGHNYPWWWQGEPIMPVVCDQWDPTARELLPVSEGDLQGVKDLMRRRSFINLVGHAGAFNKGILASQTEIQGMRQFIHDPMVANAVWGEDIKMLAVPKGS